MSIIEISNLSHSLPHGLYVDKCTDFLSRFRGLMFRPEISPDRGILLAHTHESIPESAIHMFFMKFDIYVVWINSSLEIVDARMAKKWSAMLFSKIPARYTLEVHPSLFQYMQTGDKLVFKNE